MNTFLRDKGIDLIVIYKHNEIAFAPLSWRWVKELGAKLKHGHKHSINNNWLINNLSNRQHKLVVNENVTRCKFKDRLSTSDGFTAQRRVLHRRSFLTDELCALCYSLSISLCRLSSLCQTYQNASSAQVSSMCYIWDVSKPSVATHQLLPSLTHVTWQGLCWSR